jgi:hypothetical protein
MIYFLPGVRPIIDNHSITRLTDARRGGGGGNELKQTLPKVRVLIRNLVHRTHVATRHHQQMDGRLGIDIGECDESLVLLHEGGGDIAPNNLAKDTVIHT